MTTPTTDVVVVGCGVIGAAISWRLAQQGVSVVCLDPHPGAGATYASAGMLAAATEAAFGEHEVTQLNVESARRWPAFARELEAEADQATGWRRTGTLTVAYDAGDRDELRRLRDLHRRWGLEVDELTALDARRLEPLLGPRLAGALWAPGDDQVNPRQLHAALLVALGRRGVQIVRRRAVRLESGPGGEVSGVVDDAGDTYVAGLVVLAAGWDLPGLLPRGAAEVPIRPVKGQILRLSAATVPEFDLRHVVRGLVQGRPVYVVPRADGEVVVGATAEEHEDDRQVTAGAVFAIVRDARALVPGLDELPVTELTARARPGTPDNVPVIGETGVQGLLVAGGHYRNGVLLTPLTADAIATRVSSGSLPGEVTVADPSRFTRRPVAI